MRSKYHKILLIVDLVLIVALTAYLSFATGMWDGYPIGTDAYAHLSKVKFMDQNFPNFEWFSYWANGMPMFLWYSIVPYLIILGLSSFMTYELAIQLASIASIFTIAYSIYHIVHTVSKSRFASMLAAIVTLTMPAIWGRMAMGEIPRLIGTAFLPLAWLVVVKYLTTEKPSRKFKFLTIGVLALAFSGHYIITGVTVASLIVLFWVYSGIKSLAKNIYEFILPGLILASFTVLPFFASAGLRQVFGEGLFATANSHAPTDLMKFINIFFPLNNRIQWIDGGYGDAFHWLIIPLVVVFLFLALSRREKHDKNHEIFAEWRVLKSFAYISLAFTLFGTAMYFGYPGNLYNASLPPTDMFYFLAMSLPIVIGLGFHYGVGKYFNRIIVFILAVLSLAAVVAIIYPFQPFATKVNDNYKYFNKENTVINEYQETIGDQENPNYRFAHNNSFIAVWFNYAFDVPQIRDYYSQALLNQNEKFWFENATFALDDNYQEVEYLLDWFGVKWLSVSYPNFNFDKFENNTDLFTPIASNNSPIKEERISTFEYTNPSPIFAATNAKTMLVVGTDASYNNLMLSLAKTDLKSDKLIPIKGEQNIELYDLEYLNKFDAVMLYDFNYLEKEYAFNLLDQYVYQGGSLFVESSGVLSKEGGEISFLPFPTKKIMPGDFGKEWDFEASSSPINHKVDTTDFGPAVYGEDLPWSMLYIEPEELRENAYPILFNHGKIVVAGMDHGQGQIYWSGINIFYHYNNYPEGKGEQTLINNILTTLTGIEDESFIQEGNLDNPQKRTITIEDTTKYSGVLLKENIFPTWTATINNKSVEVLEAGPNMMYVPLDKSIEGSQDIEFKYGRLSVEYAAWAISIGFLLWLIYSLLIHKDMAPVEKLKKKITNPKSQISNSKVKQTTKNKKKITRKSQISNTKRKNKNNKKTKSKK